MNNKAIRSESYASPSRGQSFRSEYRANLSLAQASKVVRSSPVRHNKRLPWWQRMLNALLQQRSP